MTGTTTAMDHRARAQRLKVFEPTILISSRGEQRVHILNISCTGALLHVGEAPRLGGRVRLGSLGQRDASVMWIDGQRIGIRFVTPLSEAALKALLARRGPPSQPVATA